MIDTYLEIYLYVGIFPSYVAYHYKIECIIKIFIITGTQPVFYTNKAPEILSLGSSTTANRIDGATVTTTDTYRTSISPIQPINTSSSQPLDNDIRQKYAYDYYDSYAQNAPSHQLQGLENRKTPVTALDKNFSKFYLVLFNHQDQKLSRYAT